MAGARGNDVTGDAPDEQPLRHDLPGVGQSSDPGDQDAVEVARELVLDLRAELPRLDARAAAGVALTGALLVSIVTQQPLAMPIYVFQVIAAVLLTIALLMFLAVLFPHQNVGRQFVSNWIDGGHQGRTASGRGVDPKVDAQRLAAGIAATGRIDYYTSVVVHVSNQVRKKHRLLSIAFLSGLMAVGTLAAGASTALLLGWR